jgi:hypothetical protein
MNWTKASAIAEILSSFAILLTLIYLTIEIGQNRATLQANSRQAQQTADAESLSHVLDAPELWLNLSNSNMTDSEKVQLSAYLVSFVLRRQTVWLQYQAGAIDEATWASNQYGLIDILSYSESRKWWEFHDSISAFDSNFSEYLSRLLEAEPIRTRLTDLRAFD